MSHIHISHIAAAILGLVCAAGMAGVQAAERQLLWGDTHLHTSLSGDAYALGNKSADPETAYRFARGFPVVHPYTGVRVRIGTPLDFLVVSDHAEYMGVTQLIEAGDERVSETEIGRRFIELNKNGEMAKVFFRMGKSVQDNDPIEALVTEDIRRPIWERILDAAERHNRPGEFTSLIGWEWTSMPGGANLHRVVFTPDGADKARGFIPFSSLSGDDPENLWAFLDKTSEARDMSFVAIPHNANISQGLMFAETKSNGKPIDADYARTRMRWEPVVEVLQIKGTSETHPALSPNDEFADYEIFEHVLNFASNEKGKADPGSYTRTAQMRGLDIAAETGVNPFKFGVIGSTDSHTSLSSAEEDNFQGKYAYDSIPAHKTDRETTPGAKGIDAGAQGLAAVWAEDNSREAIFRAFQRKEVYASSGPRIGLRLFGGWAFKPADAKAVDLAAIGYDNGVPMGGDLAGAPDSQAPQFLIEAVKDPKGANLDRVQVIKGWRDADGEVHQKIYDVALSDDRKVGPDGNVKPVGNTVDLDKATYRNSIGDPRLATVWTDPDFDPGQRAFYYLRALQIPTPRHTLRDMVALQKDHPEGYDKVIQERAISSPIWYSP